MSLSIRAVCGGKGDAVQKDHCGTLTVRAERLREGVPAFSFARMCAIKLKLVPLTVSLVVNVNLLCKC